MGSTAIMVDNILFKRALGSRTLNFALMDRSFLLFWLFAPSGWGLGFAEGTKEIAIGVWSTWLSASSRGSREATTVDKNGRYL